MERAHIQLGPDLAPEPGERIGEYGPGAKSETAEEEVDITFMLMEERSEVGMIYV